MKRLLALPLLLAACGSPAPADLDAFVRVNTNRGIWQDAEQPPFRFILEQTFGSDEDAGEGMLGDIGSTAVDRDGNVYIFDRQASTLTSFHPDGGWRWTIGGPGEAPGEFSRVGGLLYDGAELLYVSNLFGRRIDRYSLDGVLVDSHDSKDLGVGLYTPMLGMPHPDTLVVADATRGTFGVQVSVIVVSEDWRVAKRFVVSDSVDSALPDGFGGPAPTGLHEGKTVTGSTGRYRLQVHDLAGGPKRVVERQGIDMSDPIVATSPFVSVWFLSEVSAQARVGDYTIVNARWPTNLGDPDVYARLAAERNAPRLDYATFIDLYDSNWTLLYSAPANLPSVLPGMSVLTVDHLDRIYTRLPDQVRVGRYRLEVTAP